jgi:hypothetical protein
MKALIIYESMYGNTRAVAEAIAAGLRDAYKTEVLRVSEITGEPTAEADLVVVGGPTHVHGLSRPSTRKSAAEAAASSDGRLALEPRAEGPGLREWFAGPQSGVGKYTAAFDTRLSAPPLFTGRASVRIAKRLRELGYAVAADPASFLVDKQNTLLDGELDRAEAWGRQLAEAVAGTRTAPAG